MSEDLVPAPTPQQQEAQLADHYLDGAILARTVSYKALELALKQIEDGTLRDPAKTAMNAAITSGTLLDKRLLLQERPTQIVHTEDPKQGAQRLARRLGVTIEAVAHDVEPLAIEAPSNAEPNTNPLNNDASPSKNNALPLPSRSVAAKPRARTRRTAASKPSD